MSSSVGETLSKQIFVLTRKGSETQKSLGISKAVFFLVDTVRLLHLKRWLKFLPQIYLLNFGHFSFRLQLSTSLPLISLICEVLGDVISHLKKTLPSIKMFIPIRLKPYIPLTQFSSILKKEPSPQ